MQLAHELTHHFGNMKSTLAQLVQFRPPKSIMLILLAGSFVSGWKGGWLQGMTESDKINRFSSAAYWSIAAKDRADGNSFMDDRFYRNAVDDQVQMEVREMNADTVERLMRFVSPLFWFDGNALDPGRKSRLHDAVVRFAEQRLTLAKPPTEQTRRALQEMNRSYLLESTAAEYVSTAIAYSALLGRKVPPEALVTDVQMREKIFWAAKGQ